MTGSLATDPVTREIIKNYLYSAADTCQRSSENVVS